MDTVRWQKLKQIFNEAIELDRDARRSFLEEACGDDSVLRDRVEALLRSDEDTSSFNLLNTLPIAEEDWTDALIGEQVGQYRIKGIISAGGMGTVYEAEQETPRRTVAVKVMNLGITSGSAIKRFEYESQILARLKHPGIAQVFEAGRHRMGDGSLVLPFFVMEYIEDARPITQYVQEEDLSTKERIKLFLQACRAVQHGNQKGIIHRDLKPGNILVDRSGQVKVIDFGVARVTESDLQLTSLHTEMGQIIGTLQYMSPEQSEGDPQDLDVRSDVYSLGVVLYEMLLDQVPYNVRNTPVIEAARRIRESVPRRPSTIKRNLRGDIETIVLTALEKEPARRYQSVNALAEDIRRYLEGELILARPAGPVTRVVKAVKRKPVLTVGLGVGVISFLLFLLYVVFVSYPKILEEQKRTAAALDKASDRAKEKAEINLFLEKMLAAAHPFREGKDVKVVEVLDQAAEDIHGAFPDQPGVEASLRNTIGWTYMKLGVYDKAETHLRAAVEIMKQSAGPESVETFLLQNRLAAALKDLDRMDEAVALLETAFEGLKAELGPDHTDTLLVMVNLGKSMEVLDRLDEAETIMAEALERYRAAVGDEHLFTLDVLSQLASVKKTRGDLPGAAALFNEALEMQRKHLGPRHFSTLLTMNSLALLESDLGNYPEAETLFREVIEIRKEIQGEEHPSTLATMHNLTIPLFRQGKLAEAEVIQRELLRIRQATLGPRHRDSISNMLNLANTVMNLGRYDEAEELYQESLELLRTQGYVQSLLYVSAHVNLGILLRRQGKLTESEAMQRKVIEENEERYGEKHKYILYARHSLAQVLHEQAKAEEAEAINREVLRVRRSVLGDSHSDTLKTMNNLGLNCMALGKYDEAEELFTTMYEIHCARFGEDHYDTLKALRNLGQLQALKGEYALAEATYRDVWRLRTASLGEGHPETLSIMMCLARLLRDQGKYDEAEALFTGVIDLAGDNLRFAGKGAFGLAKTLEKSGDHAEAESRYQEALEAFRFNYGSEHRDTLSVMADYGMYLALRNELSRAKPLLADAAEIAARFLPDTDDLKGRIHSNYGVCLMFSEEYEEAETHLLKGHGMTRDPEEQVEAGERLLLLYKSWGKTEEMKKWQEKLESS